MPPSSFKLVYVPADGAEPLQQWELQMEPGQEVEALIDRLKAHFASTGPKKSAAAVLAQQADLRSRLPEGASVDQSVLNAATSLSMVENIALLSNARDNGFIGVNMYCDDEGTLRGLPPNRRASEIAHCCGKPLEVRGDAFLARVMDNGDDFQRLDFTLDEVSSSAPWVRQARQQAERRRTQEGGEAVLQRMRAEQAAQAAKQAGGQQAAPAAPAAQRAAPAPVLRELTPAEAAKEEGNAAFKRGDWAAAEAAYTRALEAHPFWAAALNNRAQARLKLGQWAAAEADASAVLAQEASNVKALLRRAAARRELGRAAEAAADARAALAAEPRNKEAAAVLAAL